MKLVYTEDCTQTIIIDLSEKEINDMVNEDGELTPEGRERVFREIAVHGYNKVIVHDTSVTVS